MTDLEIDVVIPTTRVQRENLERLLNLPSLPNVRLNFFVVIDDPAADSQFAVDSVPRDGREIGYIRNKANLGASASRNLGIEAGKGDYVLFLDDDVSPNTELIHTYVDAIARNPECIGFAGIARFPPPVNNFTSGIVQSDILTFWTIAETREWLGWGVTANLMLKRSAIGDVRFSTKFPKAGGGEDIDFCLRICDKAGRLLKTVPSAEVTHYWWKGGKERQYRRFFRWAYGDSKLPSLFQVHAYRNFPNAVETIALGFLVCLIVSIIDMRNLWQFLIWTATIPFIDIAAEVARLKVKNGSRIKWAVEADIIRFSNDLGRFIGNASRLHTSGFTERFDYFTTGESIHYERKMASMKFTLFLICLLLLMTL